MRPRPALLFALLVACLLALPASAQDGGTITHSSQCSPEGASSTYFPGETIRFKYHGDPLDDLPALRVPPCVDVELDGGEVQGKPPFVLQWETANGLVFPGRKVSIDTGLLDSGRQTVVFSATNSYGAARSYAILDVLTLVRPTPVADENPSPDLTVTFTAEAPGAHEWRWTFGDLSGATGWLENPCRHHRSEVTHTFPGPGTYHVTATARNCRDGQLTSAPFEIRVGDPNAITLTRFEALGCDPVFCVFATDTLIRFAIAASASADRYLWDWDGNGTVDEITTSVVGHRYEQFGVYRPILTVERGSASSKLTHERLLLVQ